MAEFKDISLFSTVIPNAVTAQNMFIQVSATEKISVASIAKLVNVPAAKLGSWTPKAGTVISSDTILQALQKLQGNISNLPSQLEPADYTPGDPIEGGFVYMGTPGSTIIIDPDTFGNPHECSILICQGGQWSQRTFTSSGTSEILVQKDLNDHLAQSEDSDYCILVFQYLGIFNSKSYFAVNGSIYN